MGKSKFFICIIFLRLNLILVLNICQPPLPRLFIPGTASDGNFICLFIKKKNI